MAFGKLGAMGRGFGTLGVLGTVVPSWVLRANGVLPAVDMDLAGGRYYGGSLASLISTSRSSSATDLLPNSASGFAYSTFSSNVPVITPGSGLLPLVTRTNLFLNSTAPATQTITLSATGNYTLWVNGSGSAAIAAGTATITGAGTATNGSPVTINCTATGTVTVTITGSLNFCQLEAGSFGTSGIVTAGVSATRAADNLTAIGSLLTALTRAGANSGFIQFIENPYFSTGLAAARGYLLNWADTGNTRWCVKGNDTANAPSFTVGDGTTVSNVPLGGNAAAGSTAKFSWRWSTASADAAASLNGAAAATAARQAPSLSAPIYVGGNNGLNCVNSYISRLTIWNAGVSDATLASLTS